MRRFYYDNKKILFFLLICVIASYGMKLFLYNYSIDTEYIMSRPAEYLNNDLLLNRFTTPTLKYALGLIPFELVKTKILTLIMICVFTLTIIYMTWSVTKEDVRFNIFYWIFIPVFLFHPVWAECFFFVEQSFEVSFGIWLTFLSSAFAFRWILHKKSVFNGIISIILLALALGTYQVMMPLFITVSISFYLLFLYCGRRISPKNFIYDIVKFLIILLTSLIIWQIIANGYVLENNSSYISNMMVWGSEPIVETLKRIIIYIGRIVLGKNAEYNLGYIVLSVICLSVTWRLNKKQMVSFRVIILVAALALIASPFYLSIIQGKGVFCRVQFMLPFCEAWLAGMMCVFLRKKWRKIITVFCILIAVEELFVTNLLYLTQHKMYEAEVAFTEEMDEKIMELNGVSKEDLTVIFVGVYCPELPEWCIKSECTGHSFYEWSPSNEIGINKRVNMFMDTQGYHYQRPTEAQYKKAQAYAEDNMEVYPEEGFIKEVEKDCVVIRLSDEIYF